MSASLSAAARERIIGAEKVELLAWRDRDVQWLEAA